MIFLKPGREVGRGVKLSRSAEALRDLLVIGTSKQLPETLLANAKKRIDRYREVSGDCTPLRDRVDAEIERRSGGLRRNSVATGELLKRVSEVLREGMVERSLTATAVRDFSGGATGRS